MEFSPVQKLDLAITLLSLQDDLDTPVYLEGDIYNGDGYDSMDQEDAARIVIDTFLAHPAIQSAMQESEQLWDALKWLLQAIPEIPEAPEDISLVIVTALESIALHEN